MKSPTSFVRCVYTGRNLLYYLRRIRSILGSEADLFVNDLRGESVDRREEHVTAKSHVPFQALTVNGIFLMIVFEKLLMEEGEKFEERQN